MSLTVDPTPEQEATVRRIISELMDQLLPRDQITTLNRGQAYCLFKMTSLIKATIEEYNNTVFAHFRHLNGPTELEQKEDLLQKIAKALGNDQGTISNLLNSIIEDDVSKGG